MIEQLRLPKQHSVDFHRWVSDVLAEVSNTRPNEYNHHFVASISNFYPTQSGMLSSWEHIATDNRLNLLLSEKGISVSNDIGTGRNRRVSLNWIKVEREAVQKAILDFVKLNDESED